MVLTEHVLHKSSNVLQKLVRDHVSAYLITLVLILQLRLKSAASDFLREEEAGVVPA